MIYNNRNDSIHFSSYPPALVYQLHTPLMRRRTTTTSLSPPCQNQSKIINDMHFKYLIYAIRPEARFNVQRGKKTLKASPRRRVLVCSALNLSCSLNNCWVASTSTYNTGRQHLFWHTTFIHIIPSHNMTVSLYHLQYLSFSHF